MLGIGAVGVVFPELEVRGELLTTWATGYLDGDDGTARAGVALVEGEAGTPPRPLIDALAMEFAREG